MNRLKALEDLIKPLEQKSQINIAIAGGSGSGKTTIANILKDSFNCKVAIISLDKFFKEPSKLPKYYSKFHQSYQADYNQPDSLKQTEMLEHCQNVSGNDIAIFDGHFALYYPELRQLMDIKIFVDCPLELMLERRSERNLSNNYGGSQENIFHYNQECVVPSYQKYILASKDFADIVLNNIQIPDKTISKLVKAIPCG